MPANYYRGNPPSSPNLVTVRSPSGVSFSVNSAAAPAFQAFINAAEARGYKLNQGGDSGGYNYRKIGGSNRWSQHAWGNAIDVNQIDRNQVAGDYPEYLDQLAAQFGLVPGTQFGDKGHFEWGGPNSSVKLPDNKGGSSVDSTSGPSGDGPLRAYPGNNPFDNPSTPMDDPAHQSSDSPRAIDALGLGNAPSSLNPDTTIPPRMVSDPGEMGAFWQFDDPINPDAPHENQNPSQGGVTQQGPAARQVPGQFGPADFIGSNFQGHNFDIQRFLGQYLNYPAGAPFGTTPEAGNNPHVLVGNEFLQGDQSGPSFEGGEYHPPIDPETGRPVPTGPVLNPELLADSAANDPTAVAPTRVGTTPGMGGMVNSQTLVGTSTPHDYMASLSTPIFGVGSSGQRYYNAGQGWIPVGQAPADARWAPNSGTGNATATNWTRGYVSSGGDPGAPNMAQSDTPSTFRSGRFQMDSEGGLSQVGEQMFGTTRPTATLVNSPEGIEAYNQSVKGK